jgi:hypothetical protein
MDERNRRAIDSIIRLAEHQANIQRTIAKTLASSARYEQSLGIILANAATIQNNSVGKMFAQLNTASAAAVKNIINVSEVLGRIQKMLPDKQELDEIEEIIDKSGFDFVAADLEFSFVRGLRAKKTVKEANAAFTKRLLRYTNSAKYWQELEKDLKRAGLTKGRIEVIHDAYQAHRKRQYSLSVPVLLAQMEYTFTRLLIADGKLKKVGNKIIVLDSGRPKLDRNGRPIQAMTLRPKADVAQFSGGSLKSAVDHLLNELVTDRNDILHGRKVSYGKAKLSLQLLLLIEVFAGEIINRKKAKS